MVTHSQGFDIEHTRSKGHTAEASTQTHQPWTHKQPRLRTHKQPRLRHWRYADKSEGSDIRGGETTHSRKLRTQTTQHKLPTKLPDFQYSSEFLHEILVFVEILLVCRDLGAKASSVRHYLIQDVVVLFVSLSKFGLKTNQIG